MAENEQVPMGTRYDALRMLPLRGWPTCEARLRKFLARDVPAELQMGAVSGTVDVNAPEATQALMTGLPGFTPANRTLALDGMLRTADRVNQLLDGLESGEVRSEWLNASHRKRLLGQTESVLRRRAERLVQP
jgi:hypothetical protein